MHTPLQITFRNFERSPAVEAKVHERAEKLEHLFGDIMSCHVAVELLHKHHQKGNHYHVRIDVTVPGDELVASREAGEHHAYTDVYVALRDAFDTMGRLLEDYARRMRREVKTHEVPLHGRIAELHRAADYGRIEASDGALVYFHRNSVVDADFDDLAVDAEVRYAVEQGERGPQATTVHVVGKHHIVG
jgi:ribosome-associated translation inhibitor RaiA/cold shock CspA family protein